MFLYSKLKDLLQLHLYFNKLKNDTQNLVVFHNEKDFIMAIKPVIQRFPSCIDIHRKRNVMLC